LVRAESQARPRITTPKPDKSDVPLWRNSSAGLWRFPRLLGSVQIVGGVRRALEIL
jgi:hypothetical protein